MYITVCSTQVSVASARAVADDSCPVTFVNVLGIGSFCKLTLAVWAIGVYILVPNVVLLQEFDCIIVDSEMSSIGATAVSVVLLSRSEVVAHREHNGLLPGGHMHARINDLRNDRIIWPKRFGSAGSIVAEAICPFPRLDAPGIGYKITSTPRMRRVCFRALSA